jgi:hypothetical protein
VLELAHDAEGLIRLIRAARQLTHQIAEAMSLRPDKYDRFFKERFAPQLQANPVAAMLGLDYESARDEEATAHCRLVFQDGARYTSSGQIRLERSSRSIR